MGARSSLAIAPSYRNGVSASGPETMPLSVRDLWRTTDGLLALRVLAAFGPRDAVDDAVAAASHNKAGQPALPTLAA